MATTTKLCGDEQLAWTGSFNGRDYLAYALSIRELERSLIVVHVFKDGGFLSPELVPVDRFPRRQVLEFIAERIEAFCMKQGHSRLRDDLINVSGFENVVDGIHFSLKIDPEGNSFLLPRELTFYSANNGRVTLDLTFPVGEDVGRK